MTAQETHKIAIAAEKCLQKAVIEEYRRKAMLGQCVIISRNGKACRVSAKEALKMAKAK